MTTIFIDADACPVTRDALGIARSRGIPVVLAANETQNFSRYAERKGVDLVEVPTPHEGTLLLDGERYRLGGSGENSAPKGCPTCRLCQVSSTVSGCLGQVVRGNSQMPSCPR